MEQSAKSLLPEDFERAALVGRVWRSDVDGPSVVTVRDGLLVDVTESFPTVRDLTEEKAPSATLSEAVGEPIGDLSGLRPDWIGEPAALALLGPTDLHAVKAAGVTFIGSLLERLVEERAAGDNSAAKACREAIESLGEDIRGIRPGSAAALQLRTRLVEQGQWSPYLEVGLGPDAEIFTKCQPMSAVGSYSTIGVPSTSAWNNPEPEVVLICASDQRVVGACLGNDVNLRDVEGRSALLLGRAKDNVASCAIGPFIRLFDDSFSIDDVATMTVEYRIAGEDGFALEGSYSMDQISRTPSELVSQVFENHQYPDGMALFLGTDFAPTDDRDVEGAGFTHRKGDGVTISSPQLGVLHNRVANSGEVSPWHFGTGVLMQNLADRGILGGAR